MNPAFIVDGFTELTIIQKICPNRPIKRSINGKDVSLKRTAAEIVTIIRAMNNRYYPIVILTDREKRPDDFLTVAAELNREIIEQLATKNITADIRIGVADRMIENWILADANALGNPVEIPDETDGLGGKGLMRKIMPTYNETGDGSDLFLKADPAKMYENSPSFKHFVNQLEDLNCPYLDFDKN
jgi:Domain of unknown function (DUF4276)